jgi:hypothetical protein
MQLSSLTRSYCIRLNLLVPFEGTEKLSRQNYRYQIDRGHIAQLRGKNVNLDEAPEEK